MFLLGIVVAPTLGPTLGGWLALLDQQVMRQASMLSYDDAWRLLLSFLVVAPAILLLRKPGASRRAAVDAH